MPKKIFVCPRCKNEVKCFPALSRRDGKTEICDSCGTGEALFDAGINRRKYEDEKEALIKKERAWLDEINELIEAENKRVSGG